MAQQYKLRLALCICGFALANTLPALAATEADTQKQIEQLQQQNQALQDQLRRQQALIDSLASQVKAIQDSASARTREAEPSQAATQDRTTSSMSGIASAVSKVRISGEGGVAIFESGSQGMYPQNSFRIDEARLFVEAPIFNNVYFYSELNLATREEPDLQLSVGELYLDFENLSRLWGQDRVLNLRVGRMYTPFGEEYQRRYAIDNPLISHSLTDLWAVDEGLELYGGAGKLTYAMAVQNGGISDTQDFDGDKSVAGRIGYDPNPWLHLSASGMRTGHLDVHNDHLSAMWFGNAFFRSLGSAGTTKFEANLAEGDIEARLPHGVLRAFGGYIHYGDNDPAGQNRRDVYYYTVEGVHDIVGKLYAAARFNQIFADKGFPIVGSGDFEDYFVDELTKEIWRLNLGLGYRFSDNLVVKAEYSFGQGKTTAGASRDHEDFLGAEAAFKF
ncbi:MAG: hypothetical protein C5B50_07230 [Verrucomicrobia bacterium]|nr:MAG: hypothetical protein C5B50_07230 [Verrucomicrobiota bacterium]